MDANDIYTIIGAGQAAGRAAECMRAEGFEGRVIIVGNEKYPPYERPPLSKQVLNGEEEPEATYLHTPTYYEEQGIELELNTTATSINRKAKSVSLDNGTILAYTKLLIATGSQLNRLSVPGANLWGIHYLRGIDDSLTIRKGLSSGAKVVVVGGGYIGLEVAAAARKRNCQVTVIEMLDQVLSRATATEIGLIFEKIHQSQGVKILTNTPVTGFEGDDQVRRVVCGGDRKIDADIVIIGVGISPNDTLASTAGLATRNGIVVDKFGRTEDPYIYAAGDVTNQPNKILGRRIRLESWQNAQNQGITAAKAMCGTEEANEQPPWFWSDQYDNNLQIIGLPENWSELVFRGDIENRRFTAFYLDSGRVVGANAVNNARDIPIARQMIQRGLVLKAETLKDSSTSLRKLLKSPQN